MKHISGLILCGSLLLVSACGNASDPAQSTEIQTKSEAEAQDATATKQQVGTDLYEDLKWEDLMPEGEENRLLKLYAESQKNIAEGSASDQMVQIGTFNVVEELDGLKVRIPGFTVPFDFSKNAEITEFLLVPYFGACLHAPPPPPNQTLFVTTKTPIRVGELDQAVWVEGVLHTTKQTSELADTAYTLELDHMEPYK